jgi:hypothetical protein
MGLHVSDRRCIPAAVFARLPYPPTATREGDQYCWDAPTPGLGDRIAAGLAAIGITEARLTRLLGRPCGCNQRQARLNELGRRLGIG